VYCVLGRWWIFDADRENLYNLSNTTPLKMRLRFKISSLLKISQGLPFWIVLRLKTLASAISRDECGDSQGADHPRPVRGKD
jgi:hypothetical protein